LQPSILPEGTLQDGQLRMKLRRWKGDGEKARGRREERRSARRIGRRSRERRVETHDADIASAWSNKSKKSEEGQKKERVLGRKKERRTSNRMYTCRPTLLIRLLASKRNMSLLHDNFVSISTRRSGKGRRRTLRHFLQLTLRQPARSQRRRRSSGLSMRQT
jgi:hypothetical protein